MSGPWPARGRAAENGPRALFAIAAHLQSLFPSNVTNSYFTGCVDNSDLAKPLGTAPLGEPGGRGQLPQLCAAAPPRPCCLRRHLAAAGALLPGRCDSAARCAGRWHVGSGEQSR